MMRRSRHGFSLLEVMIALLILAVSLSVLLQAQASGLANAARARDMTVAALLARGKMIDIEQGIFDEGFVDGEQVEKGNFEEEGHGEITWTYRIAEIDFDISLLNDLCGESGDGEGGNDCEQMIGGFGGLLEPVTQNIANAVRLVELELEWPTGKYKDGFSVRTLLTREGFTFAGQAPGGTPDPTDPNDPNNQDPNNQDPNNQDPNTPNDPSGNNTPGAPQLPGGLNQ